MGRELGAIRGTINQERKAILRNELLTYLTDEQNHWPTRHEMAGLVGLSVQRFYHYFSPLDLAHIEAEARIMRRKSHKRDLDEIDKAIIRKAKTGNVNAAALVYDKLDEPTPKKVEVTGENGAPVRIQAEALLAALIKAESNGTDAGTD
jgi:hypothetical protein